MDEPVIAQPAVPGRAAENTPVANPMDPPETPGVNPELAGTSFETTQALVDGYKSLQAELTKIRQGERPNVSLPGEDGTLETPAEEVIESTAEGSDETGESDVVFDWDNATSQYDPETGWSDAAKQHFEKVGIPQALADEHMALRDIASKYFRNQAAQMVGGEETLAKVLTFVEDKMPQAAPDLQDPNKFEYVLEAAIARMRREGVLDGPMPGEAKTLAEASAAPESNPQNRGVSGEVLYPGSPEALRAASDPRMRYDDAYRDRVEAAIDLGIKANLRK